MSSYPRVSRSILLSALLLVPHLAAQDSNLTVHFDKIPVPIKTVLPEYPFDMRRFNVRAEVMTKFVVDTQGQVENPVAFRSTNPAFNENALLAIRQWKFKPAMSKGRPVNLEIEIPIAFQIDNYDQTHGVLAYTTGSEASETQSREDGPPVVQNVVEPVYPYDLLRAGTTGDASEAMIVDKKGDVIFVEMLAATSPQFGFALAAALEAFAFDPAVRGGVPGYARVTYQHAFLKKALPDEIGDALDREEDRPNTIHNPSELNQPLKPFSHIDPIFPTAWRGRASTGTATIEFLVNRDGHVCLPRIISASAPEFGYAAVQAVSVWLFDSPMIGGSSVFARMRIPFDFKFTKPTS